mgnify:CR=1 FL=1
MSANDAAEQLSALDLNLKEIDEETAGKVFESIKGLKQVKDVVVFNTEGKALHATMDLPEKEIV